jgi:hypothetical protein
MMLPSLLPIPIQVRDGLQVEGSLRPGIGHDMAGRGFGWRAWGKMAW